MNTLSVFVTTATQDGTWIVRDPFSGLVASGRSLAEAVSELRRLLTFRRAG
jgi:hypothetical protein